MALAALLGTACASTQPAARHYVVVLGAHNSYAVTFKSLPDGSGFDSGPLGTEGSTYHAWRTALTTWLSGLSDADRASLVLYTERGPREVAAHAAPKAAAAALKKVTLEPPDDAESPDILSAINAALATIPKADSTRATTLLLATDGRDRQLFRSNFGARLADVARRVRDSRAQVAVLGYTEEAIAHLGWAAELSRRAGGSYALIPQETPEKKRAAVFGAALSKAASTYTPPRTPKVTDADALAFVTTASLNVEQGDELANTLATAVARPNRALRIFAESRPATAWLPNGTKPATNMLLMGRSEEFRVGDPRLETLLNHLKHDAHIPAKRSLLWIHAGKGSDYGDANAAKLAARATEDGVRMCTFLLRGEGDTTPAAGMRKLAQQTGGTFANMALADAVANPKKAAAAVRALCQ